MERSAFVCGRTNPQGCLEDEMHKDELDLKLTQAAWRNDKAAFERLGGSDDLWFGEAMTTMRERGGKA